MLYYDGDVLYAPINAIVLYPQEEKTERHRKIKPIRIVIIKIHKENNLPKNHTCFYQNTDNLRLKCPICKHYKIFKNSAGLTKHILIKHNTSDTERSSNNEIFTILEKIIIAIDNDQSIQKIAENDTRGVLAK